ncbi:hypothetical protein [Pontibacillus marinus]|uniref:hypothetical protein n=1 Tax=Pontibacillus marinus TaxID=273164 RepID=UPI0018CCA6DD|nr:hypothetical protein [Pontibacillus marinus]
MLIDKPTGADRSLVAVVLLSRNLTTSGSFFVEISWYKRIKETRLEKRIDVDLSYGGEGSPFVAGRWS